MKKATQYLIVFLFFFSWTCSLEKIDPSVKYNPCLNKVKAIFTHNKVGISCDSPCVVAFTNSSTGTIKSYAWDFKDGTSSTEKEPTHTFKKSANVTLTVIADNGCTDSTSVVVTVSSTCVKPNTDFTFVDGQTAPATVKFTNLSLNTDNTFVWSVVDGVDTVFRSTAASPQFDFKIATTYQVTLTAKNSCGSKSLTKNLSLKAIMFSKVYPPGISSVDRKVDVGNWVKTSIDGTEDYLILGTSSFYGSGLSTPTMYFIRADKNGNYLSENKPQAVLSASEYGTAVTEERRMPGGLAMVLFGTSNTQAVSLFTIQGSLFTELNKSTNMSACNYVETVSNGLYATCGKTASGQIYLSKTFSTLSESQRWSGAVSGVANCVRNTKDNGFITCGVSANSFYLLKTDANMTTVWQNAYTTTSGGIAKSVAQNSKTGEYTACGYIGNDMYFLTVNATGTLVSSKTKRYKSTDLSVRGVTLNGAVAANCIKETYDGNFIIGGSTTSTGIGGGALLIKMNAAFDTILWIKNLGSLYGEINFVEETPDGGYMLTGKTTSSPSVAYQSNVLFVKTDKNGNVQ